MSESWLDQREYYKAFAKRIEPTSIIVSNVWLVWLWFIGVILSLGVLIFAIPLKTFLARYSITFGPVQGYPRAYSALAESTIVHEGNHTKQVVAFGWLFPVLGWISRKLRVWVGLPFFAITYFGLFPIPYLGFGRFYLELNADRHTIAWMLTEGRYPQSVVRDYVVSRALSLSSRSYVWAVSQRFALTKYNKLFLQAVANK